MEQTNPKEELKVSGGASPDVPLSPNPKKETVVVEKSLLEQILKNQEESTQQFEEKIARLTKQNEILLAVADKSRLARFSEQSTEPLIPRANIAEWQGRIVLGWSKLKQRTHWLNGIPQLEQIATIFLQNDQKEPEAIEMDYILFWRDIVRLSGEIVAATKTQYGETKKIQLDDGRIVEIDMTFINP